MFEFEVAVPDSVERKIVDRFVKYLLIQKKAYPPKTKSQREFAENIRRCVEDYFGDIPF